MKQEIKSVMVRTGQGNIIPDTVAADELPVLEKIWGADNIEVVGTIRTEDFDLGGEAQRLVSRYGRNPVEAVYGASCALLPQILRASAGGRASASSR